MKYFFLTIFLTIVIFGTNFTKGSSSENTTDENIVYIEKRFADSIKRRVARALTKDRVSPIDDSESSRNFMRGPRDRRRPGNKRFDREYGFGSDKMFGGLPPKSDESYYDSENSADDESVSDYYYRKY
uniref:FMRFamide neuropeptide n=1 Tax=Strongyloides papillosus TaxID=174720 RepID=A0A0N5BET2_STREA